MENWSETYRGSVPPWECDVTEHFTIAYYAERLGEAARGLADELGLADLLRGAGFLRHFRLRFARELRAGASFHIASAALAAEGGALRLGHRFVDSATGETVTWIEEAWDLSTAPLSPERVRAIAGRLGTWDGPAAEERPEPATHAGFIPTGRGRVKPKDLDADGRMSLEAMVHRFTDASLQSWAAIGMTAEPEAERRGFSTFELTLRIAGVLILDESYLVESGIAHLGNSSMRMIHRLSDPQRGAAVAQMSQYGVNLDLDARRPAKWPEAVRARAERLVIPLG